MSIEEQIVEFKLELQNENTSYVASRWMMDRIPFIFGEDSVQHIRWKEALAAHLGADSRAISIIGSSCLGFSLNPYKNFKMFDTTSDIDVAIISAHYFDVSWHCLRNLGTRKYSLTREEKRSVDDHIKRLIYWGTIATDKIIGILPFGKEWLIALSQMANISPTEAREINVRIYRDFESLRAYQVNNLEKIRNQLLSPITGDESNGLLLKHDP